MKLDKKVDPDGDGPLPKAKLIFYIIAAIIAIGLVSLVFTSKADAQETNTHRAVVVTVAVTSDGSTVDRRIYPHINGGECAAMLDTMKLDAGEGTTIHALCEKVAQ